MDPKWKSIPWWYPALLSANISTMKPCRWLPWTVIMGFSPTVTLACTAFMMSEGDKVLVGNNEEYHMPHTRIWFIPSENGNYGRVYFG
jgi:hypothetical protein